MSFELNNKTLLLGYLAHLRSLARKQSALRFEFTEHPDATPKKVTAMLKRSSANGIQETWNLLREQLITVLGPGAAIKPYGQIVESGTFRVSLIAGRDPFRITMKALKLKADKARRKHPKLTLLQSWDIDAKEPKE